MQVRPVAVTASGRGTGRPGTDLLTLGAVLVGVTAVIFLPQLVTDSNDFPPVLNLTWLALLLIAVPVVAAVLSRRRLVPLKNAHKWLISLPQLVVVVCLVRLDVWLEVRSGYLLAGSGEEAMAYGIGSMAATIVGLVLTGLVALGAHLGSKRRPASARR